MNMQYYGAGLEWAYALESEMDGRLDEVSVVELIPENFFRQGESFLKKLAQSARPTIVHGVELSIGSAEPLKQKHFDDVRRVADQINTVMMSEHLSMTEMDGIEIGQLTPLPFTHDIADTVCRKVDQIQKQLRVPFALENITNRFLIPDSELSETAFINLILKRTGCGLQLDLNNVDTNAYNFGFDPYEWLAEIDLSHVVSVHLAGGRFDEEGTLLDSHSAPVRDRVWDLYRYVTARVLPATTIVEWTDDVIDFESVLADVRRAEAILTGKKEKRA